MSESHGVLYYNPSDLNAYKCLIIQRLSNTKPGPKLIPSNEQEFGFNIGTTTLTDPLAVAWFLASDNFLFRGDPAMESRIIQWISFSRMEIVPFLRGIVQRPCQTRDDRYQNKLRSNRLKQSLDILNENLRDKKFLVGNQFSLADVSVSIDLISAFCSEPVLVSNGHIHLKRWFNTITNQDIFKEVLDVGKLRFSASKATKVKEDDSKKPLKILCIHGYRQNDVMFRDKLGAFRKLVGKTAEFKFISAPHKVPPIENTDENANQDQRGWWFSREDDFFKASFVSDCDKGFSNSLDLIIKSCDAFGPFDGVLGFSQGAAMAGLLCSMQEREANFPTSFKFAIFFAGFKSQSSKHAKWYQESNKIKIPSLHVYGADDKVIGNMSEELVKYFDNPVIVEHQGGHFIPAAAKEKEAYREFLAKMKNIQ